MTTQQNLKVECAQWEKQKKIIKPLMGPAKEVKFHWGHVIVKGSSEFLSF